MDKTLNRVVLFDKKANPTKPEEPKSKKKEPPKPKETAPEVPKHQEVSQPDVIKWVESHELLNIRALCRRAGIDAGSFHRWVNVKKEIPADALKKLIPILNEYGFKASL